MYDLGFEKGLAGDDSNICDFMYLLLEKDEYDIFLEGYINGALQRNGG